MAEEEQGYLLDASSIRQLREDHEYLMAMAMVPSRRRLITRGGGGGGGSPRPYVITEDNGSGGNIAVYRSRGTTTGRKAQESETSCLFEAIDETSDEVELSLCFMSGVTFTGQVVLCQNIAGTLCVTSSVSSHNLVGVADESIAAGGIGDIRIDGTVGGSAVVEAENTLDFQVDAESTVYLMFDDSKQTFYIVAAEC